MFREAVFFGHGDIHHQQNVTEIISKNENYLRNIEFSSGLQQEKPTQLLTISQSQLADLVVQLARPYTPVKLLTRRIRRVSSIQVYLFIKSINNP